MAAQAALPLMLCIGVETVQHLAFSLAGSQPHRHLAWMTLGIGLHLVLLALWCWLLALIPLGVATPLTGMSYLTIALASQFLLGERVNHRGGIGVFSIAVGFALIAGQ